MIQCSKPRVFEICLVCIYMPVPKLRNIELKSSPYSFESMGHQEYFLCLFLPFVLSFASVCLQASSAEHHTSSIALLLID